MDALGATCEWHRTTTTKVTTSSVTWTFPEVNLTERTSWPSHSVSHSHSSPAQYLHFPSRRFCRCSISWSVSTPADVTALTSGSDVIRVRFNTIASRYLATNQQTNILYFPALKSLSFPWKPLDQSQASIRKYWHSLVSVEFLRFDAFFSVIISCSTTHVTLSQITNYL